MIPIRTIAFLVTTLASAGLAAQSGPPSVLRFDAAYHLGEYGVNVPSSAAALPRVFATRGDVMLRADGTQSATVTTRDLYANPAFDRTATGTWPGTWFVSPDGRIEIDSGGVDVMDWWIAPDGAAIVGTRSRVRTDSYLLVALRKGNGLGLGTASGTYRLVQVTLRFDATGGIEGETVRGDAVFDGAGGFRLTGTRQTARADGTFSHAPASLTGSYTVAGDGALSLGAFGTGGIAAAGEALFAADLEPRAIRLTVAVRKATTLDLRDLTGSWGFGYQELLTGTGVDHPLTYTYNGEVVFTATGPAVGSYARSGFDVESTPVGTRAQNSIAAGQLAIVGGDTLRADPSDPEPLDLAVTPGGTFLLGSQLFGVTEMFLGLRICGGSHNFGTATPGLGSIAPAIGMHTFPLLGNAAFAIELADGRSRAPAALVYGLTPQVAGLPFLGGTLHVDPAGLLGALPLTLAADGSASVPFAIPNDPALDGFELVWQEIVADAAGPAGFALSDGLVTRMCR